MPQHLARAGGFRYCPRPRPEPGAPSYVERNVADYAVIALGGKQYRVREGETIVVDRVAAEPGDSISPTVLAVGGAEGISDGGSVTAEVEEHVLGPKITVFTYRAKKDSKRKMGHRSRLSRVRITGIGG